VAKSRRRPNAVKDFSIYDGLMTANSNARRLRVVTNSTARVRSAARTRQRVHRARKHRGRITLPIEVDEVALPIALVDAGLISVNEQEDRRKLAAALSKVVEILLMDLSLVASRVTPQHV
jgi:hypothetical protein